MNVDGANNGSIENRAGKPRKIFRRCPGIAAWPARLVARCGAP